MPIFNKNEGLDFVITVNNGYELVEEIFAKSKNIITQYGILVNASKSIYPRSDLTMRRITIKACRRESDRTHGKHVEDSRKVLLELEEWLKEKNATYTVERFDDIKRRAHLTVAASNTEEEIHAYKASKN